MFILAIIVLMTICLASFFLSYILFKEGDIWGLFYLILTILVFGFICMGLVSNQQRNILEDKYDINILDYTHNREVVLYERDDEQFCLAKVEEKDYFVDEVCLPKDQESQNEIPKGN